MYLNRVRLAKAKKLITEGIPLAIVAAETGFADQSHFTRHFIQTYGVTPAKCAGKERKFSSIKMIAPEYLRTKQNVPSRRESSGTTSSHF